MGDTLRGRDREAHKKDWEKKKSSGKRLNERGRPEKTGPHSKRLRGVKL